MSFTRIAKAAAGTTGAWFVAAASTLAYVSITSRIYSPGVVAAYTVGLSALSIGGILLGSGITMNLQRTPDLAVRDEDRHVGWSLASGVLLALLMLFLAEPWASLWDVREGAGFTRLLAIGALTTPLSTLTMAQLRRTARHGRASTVMAVASVTAAAFGIAVALALRSPLALAGSNVLVPWLIVVGSVIAGARVRPRLSWTPPGSRYVLGSVAYNTINYLSYNLVPWGISRFVSASALGLFSRAYTLASTPTQGVAGAISSTLFPEYRKMDDANRAASTTGVLVVATGLATLMLGMMSALATPEVMILLGHKWLGTIPMFVALTVALVMLVPQWTLSMASQSMFGFGAQSRSRTTLLLGGIVGAVAVGVTRNVYIGIGAIGLLQAAGHAVDLVFSRRSGLIHLHHLLPCYARTFVAAVPLFTLGLLQATKTWPVESLKDHLLLLFMTLLAALAATLTLLTGRTRQTIDDLDLMPARIRSRHA